MAELIVGLLQALQDHGEAALLGEHGVLVRDEPVRHALQQHPVSLRCRVSLVVMRALAGGKTT